MATATKTIKTFKAACKVKGLNPDKVLPDVSDFPEQHQSALIAAAKLFIIADVLNDGWKPNWNDNNEYKYFPWFDMEKSKSNPSGFRLDGVGCNFAGSLVGSRLCFKSREIAEYVGKQKEFLELYKDFMTV